MTVYKAITAVQAHLAKEGIAKARENKSQGFSFRGIDDVYNALAPLLGQHGLCILPRVTSREATERQSKSGGAIFYVVITVDFDFVSAEDGSKHTVTMVGEAMDSADKATNKALSAAYKYACFQVFCIPTEGENDADSTHHTVVSDDARRIARLGEYAEQYEESIARIRKALDENDMYTAAESWFELPQDAKEALWVAPTKGGPFTTEMRKVMKSAEFRKTYYGEGDEK